MKQIICCLISVLLIGCTSMPSEFNTAEDAMEYITSPKNGFVREKILANNIKVKVQLFPAVLIQKTNNPDKILYFNIQFSLNGHEVLAQLPSEEYGAYVQLFSFGMEKHINIRTESGKEYPATMVSYQPMYNTSRSNELLVVYNDEIPGEENISLVINEFGLKLGKLDFIFDNSKLKYIPTINQF